ncbi:MAG: PAS domain S-box protein [Bacteroidetes bacterium]|nr:PAS domain S-box protein [Bacteroidota bacterium]
MDKEEKNIPDSLHLGEDSFRKVFNESHFGIALVSSDFYFINANLAFCQMMGYSNEELAALTFTDITHPDHFDRDVDSIIRLRKGEIPSYRVEKRYIRKDRQTICAAITISSIHDDNGKFLYFLAMVENITERRKAVEELRKRESLLSAVLDSTGTGILAVDKEGKITHANASFAKMWRIPEEIMLLGEDEKLLEFVLDQLEEPEMFLQKVKKLYQVKDVDVDHLNFRDGRIFERMSHPLVMDGEINGRVWGFKDITILSRSEQEVKRM